MKIVLLFKVQSIATFLLIANAPCNHLLLANLVKRVLLYLEAVHSSFIQYVVVIASHILTCVYFKSFNVGDCKYSTDFKKVIVLMIESLDSAGLKIQQKLYSTSHEYDYLISNIL